jgi:hydroxyethylthiazole kinase-like uncharacterized protein yjeF
MKSPNAGEAPSGHPILTSAEASAFERELFGGNEAREWEAMQEAGAAVAEAALRDFEEIGGFPPDGRILVLVGKGGNGSDALIAAAGVLARHRGARADVVFAFGELSLRPLTQKAWRGLVETGGERVRQVFPRSLDPAYALSLDGIFGFQFRPPMPVQAVELIRKVDALSVGMRAAVDLPSGLAETVPSESAVARADFTYATGSVKTPTVNPAHACWVGRLRYLDLGFFDRAAPETRLKILTPAILDPLRGWRDPNSDKRSYGHLFLIGGSRSFPGAILMAALAARRSGAGLITVFAPASLAPAFAARAPEAMWVGWPETPNGGLAPEGKRLLDERLPRASALALGPGIGRDPATLALAADIARTSPVPLVIDADALQPDVVRAGEAPRILTPHAGEFRRIAEGADLKSLSPMRRAVVVLKGRLTTVTQGETSFVSSFGGPVLARGGSGDLLTGLAGGLLAQTPNSPFLAACRAVAWHGLAADALARARGPVAAHTTELLDFLSEVLRARQGG